MCLSVFGQTTDSLTFEVASVKRSPPPDPNGRVFFGPPRGGPGTPDPGQITWTNAALRNIVMTAYDVQTYQVTAPDWMNTERYDIVAKVPAGATKAQVNVMWQNLLKERFGMVVHHESKEFPVDELTVAKGGSKLKETDLPPDAESFTPPAAPPKLDKNGLPEMNGSGAITMISFNAASSSPDGAHGGQGTAFIRYREQAGGIASSSRDRQDRAHRQVRFHSRIHARPVGNPSSAPAARSRDRRLEERRRLPTPAIRARTSVPPWKSSSA